MTLETTPTHQQLQELAAWYKDVQPQNVFYSEHTKLIICSLLVMELNWVCGSYRVFLSTGLWCFKLKTEIYFSSQICNMPCMWNNCVQIHMLQSGAAVSAYIRQLRYSSKILRWFTTGVVLMDTSLLLWSWTKHLWPKTYHLRNQHAYATEKPLEQFCQFHATLLCSQYLHCFLEHGFDISTASNSCLYTCNSFHLCIVLCSYWLQTTAGDKRFHDEIKAL